MEGEPLRGPSESERGRPRHDDSVGVVKDDFCCFRRGWLARGGFFLFLLFVHFRNQYFLPYRRDIGPDALRFFVVPQQVTNGWNVITPSTQPFRAQPFSRS